MPERQPHEERDGSQGQDRSAIGEQAEREGKAAALTIAADGTRHRPEDGAERGERDEPTVVVLLDPVIRDPVGPGREAEPDAEEDGEVRFGEVVRCSGSACRRDPPCAGVRASSLWDRALDWPFLPEEFLPWPVVRKGQGADHAPIKIRYTAMMIPRMPRMTATSTANIAVRGV